MKKIISFDKDLEFDSIIGDINSISLDHTLNLSNNSIKGEFIITGSYKLTEASRLEDDFSFKIPVEIIINEKLEEDSVSIDIEDFNYHIENSNTLVCHIEIKIEGIEILEVENEELDRECDNDLNEVEENSSDIKSVESDDDNKSLFLSLDDNEETFSTYSVYIMQQDDTIEKVMDKYKVSKEELENYNDIDNITIGSKIIIPSNKEND